METKTLITISDIREERKSLSEPLGFVPTMGFLHEGHLSLMRAAKNDCKSVVASIFVNPTQFGANEDFDSYPRDPEKDLELLKSEGIDLVWIPTREIMYPPGYQTWVEVQELTSVLEGKRRPGHFKGVTTVVAKLLNVIQPQKAFFGQKDAQQAIVIQQMVRDLNFNLEVVICPIVREPDGLAMSSRNVYLNPAERQAATVIFHALKSAEKTYMNGEFSSSRIVAMIENIIKSEPLARIQYVSCADVTTLEEVTGEIINPVLISMAVYFGKTRLIDNIIIGE